MGPELQAAVRGCAGCTPPGSHSGSAAPPEPSPREVTAGRTLPHLQLPAASCERSHSASEGGSRAPRPRPGSCQPGGWQGERVECQHCSVSSHIRGVRQLSPRRQGHARRPSCPARRGRPALRYAGGGGEGGGGHPGCCPRSPEGPGLPCACPGSQPSARPLTLRPSSVPRPLSGAAREGDLESPRPGGASRRLGRARKRKLETSSLFPSLSKLPRRLIQQPRRRGDNARSDTVGDCCRKHSSSE